MLQQGDVNIVRREVPEDAKKRTSAVVREGETTGHKHAIEGTEFEMLELGHRIFARILSGDARIVHEEHKTINLPAGDYEFLPTHEFDHFAERSRMVRD